MERRLSAILAADIVGYSKLMGEDEAGTLAALRQVRSDVLTPAVDEYSGAIVKSMGDGWFIEFRSVFEAVACARKVQDQVASDPISSPSSESMTTSSWRIIRPNPSLCWIEGVLWCFDAGLLSFSSICFTTKGS